MNAPSATAPAPAPAPAAPRERDDEPRGAGAFEQQQAGATFERLLRAKSAARERRQDDDESDDAEPQPDGAAGLPHAAAPKAAATPSAAAAPAGSAQLEQPSATLRAAAAEAMYSTPLSPLAAGESAHQFEVSLREPLGVPVELRATRIVNPAAVGGPAAWSLTVAASARDAALLNRHLPRLNERDVDGHARVERDDEVAE